MNDLWLAIAMWVFASGAIAAGVIIWRAFTKGINKAAEEENDD